MFRLLIARAANRVKLSLCRGRLFRYLDAASRSHRPAASRPPRLGHRRRRLVSAIGSLGDIPSLLCARHHSYPHWLSAPHSEPRHPLTFKTLGALFRGHLAVRRKCDRRTYIPERAQRRPCKGLTELRVPASIAARASHAFVVRRRSHKQSTNADRAEKDNRS
jgi:hypothetical protein